jgi:hypothetical protein
MPDSVTETGQLTKLTLTAYKNNSFTEKDPDAGEYTAMFNPSSISVKLQIDREESQANGSTSSEMRFKMIKPQDYTIEFMIDGVKPVNGLKKEVPEEVQKLLKVVYTYKSDEHKPNYVMVRFGSVLLKCVLKTIDITYNLFSPNGKPIRAKVNGVFSSCIDQELSELINNKNSPDLTHRRVVKEGDKLISMANKIYKNNDYYFDVARKNGLNNFRKLNSGTEVFFPPLKKTNE